VDIAKGTAVPWLPATHEDSGLRVVNMKDIHSGYYLKIPSLDKPGVFARAATILSEHEISIEAVIQKEQAVHHETDRAWVPIVILTHEISEGAMDKAISALEALPDVVGPIKRIRVEHFADV
jgi:homoserine dehydrogenase